MQRISTSLFLSFSLTLVPSLAEAANLYVLAGATGAGTGLTWTDACTDFTGACAVSALVRGDTYYVASGSYGARTFNTAASGTTLITIRGATAADHGTGTGWISTYGVDVTQATFAGSLTFSSSYWVFDGNVGQVWSRSPSAYGFTFSAIEYPIFIFNDSTVISDVTIAHVAATAPTGDVEKFFISTDNSNPGVSNVTVSNNYLNGWQNAYWATSPGKTMDSWVFQYNMCLSGFSSSAHHGEWVNNNYGYHTNQITRWNWFEGQQDGTGVIVANNNDNVNAQIYGNVFYNIAEGNGLITGTSAGNLVSPHVYNNTFVAIPTASGAWVGGNTTGTPLVENNLLYNMSASMAVSGDYNSYFQTTNTPTETHGQVGSVDIFVNSAAGNYQLASDTAGWNPSGIPSGDGVDVLGTSRTSSRGAYQYCGASGCASPADGGIADAGGVADANASTDAGANDGGSALQSGDSGMQLDAAGTAPVADSGDYGAAPGSNSGCGCQLAGIGAKLGNPLMLGLVLLGIARRRRRSSPT